jgi:uncharacterized membrane protein
MHKLVLIAVTVTLIASVHRAAAEEAYPQPVQVVATVLQLSDQQIASLVDMLRQREQTLQPLHQKMQKQQEAIGKALQAPTPDPLAVGQLLIEARAIEKQIASVISQSASQFEQSLDDGQRQRLDFIRNAAQACPAVPAFAGAGLL